MNTSLDRPKIKENLLPIQVAPDNRASLDHNESIAPQPLISEKKLLCLKFIIFLGCIGFLIIGRFSVPDNEVECIEDRVQEWLLGANQAILSNPALRNGLQITCSAFMDILFLSTAGYWVLNGRSSCLILTVLTFYVVRALIQKIWFDPFPKNFWWYDPGFPSLVVPYGRGSDFFYSGHIGFVTICFTQWRRNKIPWMVVFTFIGGVYTTFILLTYQVHYSIDIFTGIIFAHWCFIMFEYYKDPIDAFFYRCYLYIHRLFKSRAQKEADLL